MRAPAAACPSYGGALRTIGEDVSEMLDYAPAYGKVTIALPYAATRWPTLICYCSDGSLEIDNSAAERALHVAALGRKSHLSCGSDASGERAAATNSVIGTAKLNGLNLKANFHNVIGLIADRPTNRLNELLPWNCAAIVGGWSCRRCLMPVERADILLGEAGGDRRLPVLVHLHARGERMAGIGAAAALVGSSPRSWGTPGGLRRGGAGLRFIPTLVGNAWRASVPPLRWSVHPHARGERVIHIGLRNSGVGSSPRSWGTHRRR